MSKANEVETGVLQNTSALLSDQDIDKIIREAFRLLREVGVKFDKHEKYHINILWCAVNLN
jgi:hypothetical protein